MKTLLLSASAILFTSLSFSQVVCDDFTEDWAPSGDTLGYTQGDSEVILDTTYFGTSTIAWTFNSSAALPGMYGISSAAYFEFTSGNYNVDFEVYGYYAQYDQMGFSVNGSAVTTLDGTFPMTIAGVTVDLDTTLADADGWEYATLSFSGTIDGITMHCFESGIVEMCTETITTVSSETFNDFSFDVYPNPATDRINISSENSISDYFIYNIGGSVIMQQNNINKTQLSIDVSDLTTGVYFIKSVSKNGIAKTNKVIIK